MAQGNLVVNGGFELGLAFWNVAPILITPGQPGNVTANTQVNYTHSGMMSAMFGGNNPAHPAGLWQDVPIEPSRIYELDFHIIGTEARPTDMTAQVIWLDERTLEVGLGLDIFITRDAIGVITTGQWQSHAELTVQAPNNAAFARLVFTSGPEDIRILLDDVVFALA